MPAAYHAGAPPKKVSDEPRRINCQHGSGSQRLGYEPPVAACGIASSPFGVGHQRCGLASAQEPPAANAERWLLRTHCPAFR